MWKVEKNAVFKVTAKFLVKSVVPFTEARKAEKG